MSKRSRSIQVALILAVTLLAGLHAAPEARAVTISSGFDWFLTPLTEETSVALPIGTVQLKSFPGFNLLFPDPGGLLPPTLEIRFVDQHGNTVGPDSQHRVGASITPGPFPPNGTFDTVIQRLNDVTLSGIGSTGTADIRFRYLSLMSTAPVDIGGSFFDLYVGLDPSAEQDIGRMLFTCRTADCTKGEVSLGPPDGRDDYHLIPGDEALGLPLKYVIDFIPEGADPIPANIAFSCPPTCPGGLQTRSVFHRSDPTGPHGFYDVPAPATLILLGASAACAALVRITHRRRKGPKGYSLRSTRLRGVLDARCMGPRDANWQ